VAEALHVADPDLRTVMVTGFPESDLTVDRERVGIVALLEKPFDVGDLAAAVVRAADLPAAGAGGAAPEVAGVLLVDGAETIVRQNAAARALLAGTRAGTDAASLAATFGPGITERLHSASHWVEVEPEGAGGPAFWLRARRLGEGAPSLVVLCAAGQEWRRDDPRVRTLLGLPLGRASAATFRDGMLLVDDSASVRDTFVAQLASRACPVRTAGSHARALELFRADPELRVVILDWAMPGEDLRTTVARMREIRPGVRLVGTSGEDRSREFRELGIDAFLLKPWTVAGDLAALLGGDT
jgi:CheY-like chemotaxis protein